MVTIERASTGTRQASRGFTLVELTVTMAVVAVLATLAVPSFSSMMTRGRLKNAAEQVRADFNYARTEAMKRNRTVYISFKNSADGGWCYGVSQDAACDCTAATNSCYLDADAGGAGITRIVRSTQYQGISLSASGSGTQTFNPVRPTLLGANVTLSDSRGESVKVLSLSLGRVRICSPSGDAHVAAFSNCGGDGNA